MATGAQHERRKSIKALDDELISSGILTLTGGRDRYGHALAVFPPGAEEYLCTRYTAAHIVVIIRYYYSICFHGNNSRGLAFVANLHSWKKDCIQLLVDALDSAQNEHHGTVEAVYAIQPKSKDLQKLFKKLTGIRRSKRNPRTKIYETVVVGSVTELLTYMDIRQLTEDFGGSLRYDHKSWIKFMMTVDDLEEIINRTLDKLPEAHDKLSMMCEYDVPDDQSEAELLLAQIRHKYQDVMRDLNLEHTIDECKSVLHQLQDPTNADYRSITQTQSYKDARKNLAQYEQELIRSRQNLKDTWKVAEDRVLVVARVRKYKAKAGKILDWIKEVGLPSVNQAPEIADCLSKAEILKTQYETGFYSIAKNVLWLADKIQKKLDEAAKQSKESKTDVDRFSKKFRTSTEYFRKLAQKKYNVYLNVHQFFSTSQKVDFIYRVHFWGFRTLVVNPMIEADKVVPPDTGLPPATNPRPGASTACWSPRRRVPWDIGVVGRR